MGKINGLNQDPSGMVGNIVYRQTKKGTVVAKQPKKVSTPRRSEKQMYTRCQLGNVAANFRLFEEKLALGFEDKTAGQSEFNLYIQANYGGQNAVFITKTERLNGACVVAPYQFTRGTLKSIGYGLNAENVLVTNINLGSLEIGAETTVAQFSAAVMQNNVGWEEQDQITFFYAEQEEDPMTLVPRASMDSWKVVLDLSDNSLLRNVAPALGFSTVDTKLGMNAALQDAGAAWVHSRDKGDGNIKVGTQRMYVVSDILAEYQTTAAWKRSADSYGGVNTKAVYLNPSSGVSVNSGSNTNLPDYTDDSSTGSGTNTNGGGANTGGNTETPVTVAAPSFSGDTQFTDTTQVTMTGPDGASIYYTLDGSTPTSASTQYSAPVTLSDTTTVKAIAIKDDVSSSVTERTYTKSDGNGGSGMDQN